MIEFVVPYKTPSINNLYGQRGFRRFLKPEAVKLKKNILECMKEQLEVDDVKLVDKELTIEVLIYENWYNKDGTIKRKDISNREKFLMDTIFEALKIDDKQIFKHTLEKINSNEEKAVVRIIFYK